MRFTKYLLALSSFASPLIAEPRETVGPSPEEEVSSSFLFDRYPDVFGSNFVHALTAVSVLGDTVEIEDGSRWAISYYDSYRVKNWRTSDVLVITQNHSWFSSYTYRIVNKTSRSSIEANLSAGPIKDGPYSRYVSEIDSISSHVALNDSSVWKISLSDLALFAHWQPGHSIIIGVNTGWDPSCEGLLINVTLNHAIRAHQL